MTGATGTDSRRWPTRLLAHVLFGVFVGGLAAGLGLRTAVMSSLNDWFLVPFCAFAVVGWVIALRRPLTAVGWIFLGIGALTGMSGWTEPLVNLALARHWSITGVVLFAAWFQQWFWYPLLFLSTAYTLLLFPNGLPSRRWRPVLVVLTLGVSVMTLVTALAPTIAVGTGAHPLQVSNPIGVGHSQGDGENSLAFAVFGPIVAACMVAAVVSLVVRFRRSRDAERAQLKWFLLGGSVLAVHIVVAISWQSYDQTKFADVLLLLALTAMPISCGLAIFRYRLYDIDRIVSRTVSYAIVTALVVGTYVAAIALADQVLSVSSGFAVAGSTLAAAAAFQPLRRRVQRVVDRRFDRAAYDARLTVDVFSGRLRDEVDVDAVRQQFLETVTSAVAPTSASLWVLTSAP